NCNSQHLLQHIFGGIQRQQKGSKARHASRQHLVTPSCALDHEPNDADAIDWHAVACRDELQQQPLLLEIPRLDNLPEPLYYVVICRIAIVCCRGLQAVDIDLLNSFDERLERLWREY